MTRDIISRRVLLALGTGVTAVALAACGSGSTSKPVATTASSTTSPATEASGGASTTAASASDALTATIDGRTVRLTSQFAQYDPGQKSWWLYLLSGAHTCDDNLNAVSAPHVFWDVDAAAPEAIPAVGPVDAPAIAFDFPDSPTGPFTVNNDTTLEFTAVSATTGGHWTGRISVASRANPFDSGPGTHIDAIDGAFDATVCPPRSSMG